jgi:organic hydroperoxide reductase OsmC/OhrA
MDAAKGRADGHRYEARVVWTGNTGTGTAGYTHYSRDHVIQIEGKPELEGSADALFQGEAARHNPEDLFVAAIAACHMLAYLALCARRGVNVLSYEDASSGVLHLDAGGGRFTGIVLRPVVEIDDASDADVAQRLHAEAHARCFIASSCSVPIRHEPTVRRAPARRAAEVVQ